MTEQFECSGGEGTLCREVLANGITIEFKDRGNRYFGDYHRVRVQVLVRVPVPAQDAAGGAGQGEARSLLGEEIVQERFLDKMGVPGAKVEAVQRSMIEDFLSTNRPYFGRPGFIERLVVRELQQKARPSVPKWLKR